MVTMGGTYIKSLRVVETGLDLYVTASLNEGMRDSSPEQAATSDWGKMEEEAEVV